MGRGHQSPTRKLDLALSRGEEECPGPGPWRVPVGGSPILTMSVTGRRDPWCVAVAQECSAALARARVVVIDAGPARGVNRRGGGSVLWPESDLAY